MARTGYQMRQSVNENYSAFESNGSRLVWRFKEQTLWLEPWGRDSFRVRATTLSEMPLRDWSLVAPTRARVKISLWPELATVVNGKLTATIDAKSGRVRFFKT